jgi:hypothetical protein
MHRSRLLVFDESFGPRISRLSLVHVPHQESINDAVLPLITSTLDFMCEMMNQNKRKSSNKCLPGHHCNQIRDHDSHQHPSEAYWHDSCIESIADRERVWNCQASDSILRTEKGKNMVSHQSCLGISNQTEELTSFEQFTRKTQENLDGYRVKKTHSINKLDKHTNT